MDVFGDCINTAYSNNYATPYATTPISNQFINSKYQFDVKKSKKFAWNTISRTIFNADWISNALIIGDCGKSKANYYFNYTEDLSKIEDVDTIIICENNDINFDIGKKIQFSYLKIANS